MCSGAECGSEPIEESELLTETAVVCIAVPVRTASELPYRLQDFELRMFYAADIAQPISEVGKPVLLVCVCLEVSVQESIVLVIVFVDFLGIRIADIAIQTPE